jgi:hypothetical protein
MANHTQYDDQSWSDKLNGSLWETTKSTIMLLITNENQIGSKSPGGLT